MTGKPAKRSHGFTPKKKATFIALLAEGFTVTHAAEQIGLSRRAAYNHRESDPAFAEAWDEAYAASTELLEAEAFQRAMGRDEVVGVGKDGQPVVVKKYSDLLLIFLLKARRPATYRDRVDVTVTQERRIIVDLLQVKKDEATGKLVLVDGDVPLLSAGE